MTTSFPVGAAIDIGSNTIKLTVARLEPDRPQIIESRAETVRLSEGLAVTGRIRPDRLATAVDILRAFVERARQRGATRIDAVATEATRAASNGADFLDQVQAATGITVRVISGAEEAALTTLGVLSQIDRVGRVLIVDIGGGSTELIETEDGAALASVSVPVGSGRMTDLLVPSDPPTASELDAVVASTREQTGSFFKATRSGGKLVLVGGAGEYLLIVSGSANPMSLTALDVARQRSLALSAEEMAAYTGATVARARVLPAGFAIASAISALARPDVIESVSNGLRIGLLMRMAEEQGVVTPSTGNRS